MLAPPPETEEVELFLDLVPLPKEFDFPDVDDVILFREIPPVLDDDEEEEEEVVVVVVVEFCPSDLEDAFTGDGVG